ncbi:SPOR domain-containing protein [Sinomicrobium weinanense]|uniref:SPOR domain-containing protein n=1 Tax=Sinomicrobium weinanense TaxID=2842200 RepID=A0A926Q4X5_9FLAO|nr:SPOR domain-containing protein [Sinomicrobium weinanense]MBC9797546.1 SPOR domain-containing protein [Sinomicrobium weinanense]MBU3123901.1 SPOR domain-containing protein [Sinomicrobium weinanense]
MRFLGTQSGLALLFFMFFALKGTYAQDGRINIQQDSKVEKLVAARTELNKDDSTSERYQIQIYNGSLEGATKEQATFKNDFGWHCDIAFKTPTYRVYVGKFRTRLEADKRLIEVKKKYPSAFIITP